MAGSAADLSGMLTGIANTVGSMGAPASKLFQNLGAPLPDPNDPASMNKYAEWLQRMGRGEEALRYMQAARAAEATKLAAGREAREAKTHVEAEQAKAVQQTYYSLKSDPEQADTFEKWKAAMEEAGQGQTVTALEQRDLEHKMRTEQHGWAKASAEAAARVEAKKKAVENITKGWYSAAMEGDAALEAFAKKATEAGHGDLISDMKVRQAQYNNLLESNAAAREKGQILGREFFKDDESYEAYKKDFKNSPTPRLTNERVVGEHRQRFNLETAAQLRGDDDIRAYELEAARSFLSSYKDTWYDFGYNNINNLGDEGQVLERAARFVAEEAKKNGRYPTKEQIIAFLDNAEPDTKDDEWGIDD